MDEAAKDVALAWKSLQKAKAVLQRIENKFDHQMWSCAKSQAARRELWHEESFEGERNGDETAWNEKQSNEIPPSCRRGNRAALPPAWSQTRFSESAAASSGSSRATPLSREGDSHSAPCSPAGREAEDGEGMAGTWSPAKSLYPPRTDNFRDQANSRKSHIAQLGKPACSLHHPSHSPAGSRSLSAVACSSGSSVPVPTAVLLPTSCPPPASRLEEAWKKSPKQKLEQLKERIREQKQQQRAAAREQKCPNATCAKEPPRKRTVRRVVSAPPAPAYRGERSSARRTQTRSRRQPSPRSSLLERAVAGKGTKLSGASAWRQGQKLARKLLGPSPTFAKLKSTAEQHITANTLEPGRGSVAMPAMEQSSRERGNEPVGKSSEFESCVVPPSEPVNTPDEDTKQVLRNLHLQSKHHGEHRSTRLPKDTAKGKVEDLQQYLGINSPSPGVQGVTPSAFSGEKMRSSLMGAETEYRNCSRGKSTSPQRWKGSRSPAQKGSEKENLNRPSKRRANVKRPHPYSPEIIQEFMYRKNAERKKKNLEEKKSLVQALEMRNKRLQEVYRKQKEAFGKKTCSDQTHKFIKETASAEESPQYKREQKQPSSGTLERSFMAWVHKTSHTLLSKEPRSRDLLAKTIRPAKKREALASPAPPESECWFLSSLKCEDLWDCSPPALYTPPQSFSLPWQDAKLDSKDLPFGLSPYRSKQDRVKAIHSLSRELAEKVELATKRLNATSRVQDSADNISTQTTLDLFKGSSSHSEPETSKDEQDRTMTIQMLLEAPNPDELHVSSEGESHGLGRISLVGSTEGTTVQDRQETIHTPLSGGSAVSKDLPWITHSTRQRHFNIGEDLSNTLKGFLVNKGSEVDISLLHEKPISSPASPSHRFLARSPQREPPAQGNPCPWEAALEARNQEEIADRSPAGSLGTPDSRIFEPSAPLTTGAEIQGGFEQDFGEGDLSCTELEEKYGSHLGNLRQISLQLAHKLKAHQLQQKQQLAVLSEKAKLEVQESQRSLNDLLQHNLEGFRHGLGLFLARLPSLEPFLPQSQAQAGGMSPPPLAMLSTHCLENLQDSEGASAVAEKQRRILAELKQEQAEIQHLQNIYKAAHQERKLLLKHQREILMMQRSTAQLQEELNNLTGKQEVIKPGLSGNRESCVQLKNKQSKKYEGLSTENKKPLVQYQKQAEESPGLEQSLELNAQDHVFLHLEHANSARIDEAISTPIPREGKKYAFPESVLEEKAFTSSPKLDLKNNEDINPYVPVKEVEVPVTCEISQVDGSQWLKHLDPISHETSDEELDLQAFSKGLASTESSSKSHNFSLTGGSSKSDSSLPEFQKVSAVWIDISESSISDSELEVKNGEDTDVSIPEEFAYDNGDVFPNISTETLIAINDGKEVLSGDKHDEQVPKADCSPEISSRCQSSQKYPGDVPDHGCTDHLLYFILSDKENASKTKPPHSFQSDDPAKGMDEPHLEASEDYGRNDTSSQEISEQDKDADTSSWYTENCSSKGEDDTIFISDEGVLPADEDTLSEILSPVDEVLSYGSADLPSSSKKDLSFPSEDPPPFPLGVDAMKNDDSSFSTDDFPSPPEQMIFSETRQCMDEDISLKMDALHPLPDNIVPEEFPLLNPEPTDAFSTQDGNLSEQSLVKEDISSAKKDLSEHQQGEYEMSLQCSEFLNVPNPISSGETSKNIESMKKLCKTHLTLPKAEEDSDDPLLSFEIGDRVLVKKTQPGTLMFKGRTCFDSGYWAGVALDKAEGDNAGTYQGVKYFECAQHCGIFVRPDQISHLLQDNENGSHYTEDEDSDSFYDDESFQGDGKYTEDDKQGAGFTEQKAEDTNSVGGSEVKEKQSRLHVALLSGKGQKFPNSGQCKSNEFLCQNNLMCLQSDKEKTELTQKKQRILADVLPMENKTSNTVEGNTSKNICCLVEDQRRNKLADDIAIELSKKILFDTLIAFSEAAQHKHKSAFEKEVMNYGKGPQQEDNQKLFLFKKNPADSLSEQSAKVSDVLLCDFDMLSIHGCHTVAERIVTKFVDDAVKEYKKIKRKQGAKADKIFHSSSDTSPTTLPFLTKILDAGVFGSSEDFDQLNSDPHTLERQTQKQYSYKLDRWHSAPWKKTAEVPLVVPHYSSYVKKLSARAVEELWAPENRHSNCRRISVPKHFECSDFSENDLETESKRMYNQIIFDLTHELLCAEYHVTVNPNTFPQLKENLGSGCSRSLCRRTDVNEVKTFVQGEIIKIMNLEKNDLEMKRKFLNMTKYGNCKRDRVDLILIQELHKEESQWTYYDDDELTVKMRITEDIFDSLILDTIRVLNKICLRRACD
nr:PREDICTED: centrosome-associated protein 350-like [Apteryx mantelli mantelli]